MILIQFKQKIKQQMVYSPSKHTHTLSFIFSKPSCYATGKSHPNAHVRLSHRSKEREKNTHQRRNRETFTISKWHKIDDIFEKFSLFLPPNLIKCAYSFFRVQARAPVFVLFLSVGLLSMCSVERVFIQFFIRL